MCLLLDLLIQRSFYDFTRAVLKHLNVYMKKHDMYLNFVFRCSSAIPADLINFFVEMTPAEDNHIVFVYRYMPACHTNGGVS